VEALPETKPILKKQRPISAYAKLQARNLKDTQFFCAAAVNDK